MAGEINPKDLSGKFPRDTEVTYHKRGKDEEITKAEFNHRLSVFMEKNGFAINAEYHVVGTDHRKSSPFDDDITRCLAYHTEEYFNQIDEDGSGTISMSELNKARCNGDLVAEFVQNAYSINKVPDNPTDGLAEYRKSKEEISEEFKRAQTPKNLSQMKDKNFGL